MIKSDVSHRHFCAGPDAMERQADYLTHNANVMKAQLQRVDKRFFVHSSFDELPGGLANPPLARACVLAGIKSVSSSAHAMLKVAQLFLS